MIPTAVLLIAHGTVDSTGDLPEFLANIRRGHPPPPELLAEVTRRYEAIGGQSPLNAINQSVAERLGTCLGMPVRLANRMFRPYAKEVLAELAAAGIRRVLVVPLAQHSAPLYGQTVKTIVREAALEFEVVTAPNWGALPELTEAFAKSIAQALETLPSDATEVAQRPTLLLTAHSLPLSIIEAGDPYEVEFRASASAVAARVQELASPSKSFSNHVIAFQSQGMSTGPGGRPMAWLGPDLRTQLESIAAKHGARDVLVAPIGFLADHVEILYDLDIEARGWAENLGLTLHRAPSLNDSDGLIEALVAVVTSLLVVEDS